MRSVLFLLLGLLMTKATVADQQLGLPHLSIPADNPQSSEKIALGELLFNDKRFSGDGTISCASCHHPDKAFTDGLPVAKGINQQTGTRNTPTAVNAAYYNEQFLDGRAKSLETQALGPLVNPIEHGLTDLQLVVDVVQRDNDYPGRFKQVFNIPANEITIKTIAKAIASYERTLLAGDSPFDRYFFAKDRAQLSESAARGLRIFRRKGNCANCHEISWNNALFMDNRFYNIGAGFKRLQPVLDEFIAKLRAGNNPDNIELSAERRSELGRFNVTKVIADIGKFKTPTLRNIALTAPYMHDGSVATLEQVIEYYDRGGEKNRFLDAAIFPLHLTDQEKQDLVAFLQSLTSPQYTEKQ